MRWAALITLTFVLTACSGGSEEQGRIRVTPAQIVGVYESGSERLEFQSYGSYVQDLPFGEQLLHHTGRWRIVNHLFDGSEVLLINAAVRTTPIPEDKAPRLSFGDLQMYEMFDKIAHPNELRRQVQEQLGNAVSA